MVFRDTSRRSIRSFSSLAQDTLKIGLSLSHTGYQTQINNALRSFMEGKTGQADFFGLVQNEKFIAAVAERVRHIVTG